MSKATIGLTDKESRVLSQVLDELENQYSEEDDAFASVGNYDNEFIDIEVCYGEEPDGYEQMKLQRKYLMSSLSPYDISTKVY